MKNHKIIPFLLAIASLTVLLAACSGQLSVVPESATAAAAQPITVDAVQEEAASLTSHLPNPWVEEVPRADMQGEVEIEITPLNPNNPGHTLDFSVAMNTHSVDLSMDLTALATLETDTGHIVQASQWDAPLGGHHVSGILSFPAGVDDKAVLEGASKMTITLVDVDAPERVFVWER